MAGQKKIDNAEPVASVFKSDSVTSLAKQGVASGNDGISSDLNNSKTTPKNLTSGKTGETNQGSFGEHGVSYQPYSCYSYYNQGFNGSYTQLGEHGYFNANGSNTGVQSDNASMCYYLPSYGTYTSGAVMGVDGQGIAQQQYYSSSGYPQQPVSYGSEALSCYSWDPTFARDVPNGTNNTFVNGKSTLRSSGLAKSNAAFNPTKGNGSMNNKFSKPLFNSQPIKSFSKVPHLGSDFSAGLIKGYPQVGQLPTLTSQKQSMCPQNTFPTYKPYSGRVWNANDRFKPSDRNIRCVDYEASAELTRGPRSRKALSDSPVEKEELGLFSVQREKFNLPDFQTNLENAKFYVIKSYSEDDVHKCIKYNVWASTPNGNRKLDAAFRANEAKSTESDVTCPIFLFFSVNGSGQFVGVAEMVGQVDFDKDMEFWQVDKWNGFFPVTWHIVKDVPNSQLRHIILENNENKSVTFTRDTQEVGLKQGLEMLNIFKGYAEKTSLLDDFGFYENREKSLHAKRSMKPATLKVESIYNESDISKQERKVKLESDSTTSLINRTKNLSLNSNT